MKRLIVLCVIIGVFAYYFKDGENFVSSVKSAATEISASIKKMF